jgi:hypothetical protein
MEGWRMGIQAAQYTYGRLHLPRWEVSLPVARDGRTQFLAIRMVCGAVGLASPQKQFAVIHKRYGASERRVPFNVEGVGWREFVSLPSDDVALWLAGLRPEHCTITARGTLEAFITDAKAALQALIFRPDYVPADPRLRGVLSVSARQETVFACDCGRHWRIVTEDGASEVERISGDEG